MAWIDPLLAGLLLLTAAVLAIPATLAGQLEPDLSATGWWLLLSLAPALLLVARPARPKWPAATCWAAFVALSLLSLQLSAASDTLSASRALLAAIAALVALSAGAALGADGRRTLAAGMVAVSLALSLAALAGVSARTQGALLNSGATSEAALLGALVAAVGAPQLRGVWRLVAWSAVASYGAFAALAPALSGALVFALCLAVAVWRSRAGWSALGLPLVIFGLSALAALGLARWSAPPAALDPTATESSPLAGGHLGGLGVRFGLAPASLALFAQHPWLGVGPGQFRSEFPPYRNARERETSNRAAGVGVETEVEHAHNDYLTVLAEAGVLGFSAWCAALALLFLGAWRALRGFEPANRALAACVLGGLLNAALRSPLSFNPASAGLFFAAGGALLARELHASGKLRARRGFAVLLVALLFLQVPRAWSLVQHGRALRAPDAIDTRAALLACPDSPLALSLAARWLPAERNSEARALWERVLVLRPHNFEALVQAGLLAALDGDAQSARAHWEPARELAPERSSVHQNLLYLEAEFGSEQQFEAAQRASAGSVPRSWLEAAGSNAMLKGEVLAAQRLWGAAGASWLDETPEQMFERARAESEPRTALADALEFFAQLRWAREHAQSGNFANAVRSYRQALRWAPNARGVRLELAAALLQSGQGVDDARAEVERAAARARDWTILPPWAGAALLEAGLLAR
jgi:O-antigen ligase/Flp pilus assembly protein TadD